MTLRPVSAVRSLLATLAALLAAPALLAAADDEGFVPLFDGKSLDGWVRVNTDPSTWTVRDGMIVCSGKPTGELRTTRMYQNFVLEVEWRHMQPKGNAGIFVWADDITAPGVPFHRSIEVQVLENAYGNTQGYTTHGDIFPIHGAKMTPVNGRGNGSRAFPTEERSKPSPEWNHYRIVCRDGEISLAVNGKVVTQGREASPRKGYVCLESEGGVVHYRNLKIKELPATPVDPEHVAIADRGFRCLYTGIDLSAFRPATPDDPRWMPRDWVLLFDGKEGPEARALATRETFGDFAFVVDVRLGKTSGPTRIVPRGDDRAAIVLDPADKPLDGILNPVGRWNRLEGSFVGGRLTARLNGRDLPERTLAPVPPAGPLRLDPQGAVEFANLYAREIKAATGSK